jgi:hypothetical protein
MAERKNRDCAGADIQRPPEASIHWCLLFAEPLSQVLIEDDTLCTLQGLILWQNLSTFLGEHHRDFDEQMVAGDEFPVVQSSIECTIGQLRKGKVNQRLILELSMENETKNILRDVSWHDVVDMPLKQFLKGIKKKIHDKLMKDTHIVSLAGFTKESGYIGQQSLRYKVALAKARGVSSNEMPLNETCKHLIQEISYKKEYIRQGCSARVSLYNGVGDVVSRKTIVV